MKPKTSPKARATGGETNPLAAIPRPRRKTALGIMLTGANVARAENPTRSLDLLRCTTAAAIGMTNVTGAGQTCFAPVGTKPAPPGLGGSTLPERLDRLILAVVYLKHREQLGDLQQIANPLGKVGQLHCAASIVRRCVERHQRSQSAAVDVTDASQIQHNLAILGDQLFQSIAEKSRLLAKHDATIAIDNGHALHNPLAEFQLHGASQGSA